MKTAVFHVDGEEKLREIFELSKLATDEEQQRVFDAIEEYDRVSWPVRIHLSIEESEWDEIASANPGVARALEPHFEAS